MLTGVIRLEEFANKIYCNWSYKDSWSNKAKKLTSIICPHVWLGHFFLRFLCGLPSVEILVISCDCLIKGLCFQSYKASLYIYISIDKSWSVLLLELLCQKTQVILWGQRFTNICFFPISRIRAFHVSQLYMWMEFLFSLNIAVFVTARSSVCRHNAPKIAELCDNISFSWHVSLIWRVFVSDTLIFNPLRCCQRWNFVAKVII